MRLSKMKIVAERVQSKMRALPASVFLLGCALTLPTGVAHAFQTDAATKAEMDKRAAARTLLSSALGRIAKNGNNAAALLDAGRASMALDDYRSALGFLLRAEQNAPRDGAVKAALGTAMVHQENPRRALDYFGEAQLLRTPERLFIADRALAYDLLGQQEAAQRDYSLALSQQRDDELIRRYALSLGISGQPDQGIEMLAPQLAQQDRGAWRTRAMILAMNGRQTEAKSIVDATMPKELATNIWPYLAQMDRLTPSQLAEAAHFGRFPSGPLGPKRTPTQMAAAAPAQAAVASTARTGRGTARAPAATRPAVSAPAKAPTRQAQAAVVPSAQAAAQPAPQPAAVASAAPASSRLTPSQRPVQPSPMPEVRAEAPNAQVRFNPPAAASAPNAVPQVETRQRGPTTMARDMTAAAAANSAARSRVQSVVEAQTAPVAAAPAAPAAASAQRGTVGPVDIERGAAPSAQPQFAPPAPPVNASAPPPAEAAKPLAAMASLGEIIGSLQIPANELVRSDEAVGADMLVRLREERRKAEQVAAAERAAKARADAAAKAKADAEAKVKAEAEAKAREEAALKRANPARTWVQIGSGSNPTALDFTWNRYAKKHATLMRGKSGGTADWGRTRRLLVGPFASRSAAQSFLAEFKAAEGDGFIFNSAVGEVVEPIQ